MSEKLTGEVNLASAQSAFGSYFNSETMNKIIPNGEVPAEVALKDKGQETASEKRILSMKEGNPKHTEEINVEEAEQIIKKSKTFDEILKDEKISFSELLEVIDFFLEKGFYERLYKIKGLEFTLRSKKVYSIEDISERLEQLRYNSMSNFAERQVMLTVASSLVSLKLPNKPLRLFDHTKPEDDEAVLKFVKEELHSPIYAIIAKNAIKFDFTVGLSCRDEAIERFLAHMPDSEGLFK